MLGAEAKRRHLKEAALVSEVSANGPKDEGPADLFHDKVANPLLDEATVGTAAKRRHFNEVALVETAGDDDFVPSFTLRKSCMKPPFVGERLMSVFSWVSSILVESSIQIDLPMRG